MKLISAAFCLAAICAVGVGAQSAETKTKTKVKVDGGRERSPSADALPGISMAATS